VLFVAGTVCVGLASPLGGGVVPVVWALVPWMAFLPLATSALVCLAQPSREDAAVSVQGASALVAASFCALLLVLDVGLLAAGDAFEQDLSGGLVASLGVVMLIGAAVLIPATLYLSIATLLQAVGMARSACCGCFDMPSDATQKRCTASCRGSFLLLAFLSVVVVAMRTAVVAGESLAVALVPQGVLLVVAALWGAAKLALAKDPSPLVLPALGAAVARPAQHRPARIRLSAGTGLGPGVVVQI